MQLQAFSWWGLRFISKEIGEAGTPWSKDSQPPCQEKLQRYVIGICNREKLRAPPSYLCSVNVCRMIE